MTARPKKGCTPAIWSKAATAEADLAGLCPVRLMAGYHRRDYVSARWRVWKALVARGFSYNSIGKAAGFDHTTIRYGCLRDDVLPYGPKKPWYAWDRAPKTTLPNTASQG